MKNQQAFKEYQQAFKPNPLYIIPARGGSKGIPDKNIADLAGHPLIYYTIAAAKESLAQVEANSSKGETNQTEENTPDLSRIIVSTDSERIAETARRQGLEVPFLRPAELSTDTAGSREVILHAMDWADSRGIVYNCVILLQPTSPFRRGEHISGAIDLFDPTTTDMVVSVCEAESNPYYNCFETDPATGLLHISKGDGLLTRRQDAPKAWEYNGAVYVISPISIREMPLGKFPRRIPYIMKREDSLDIDTPLDLEIARIMIKKRNENL